LQHEKQAARVIRMLTNDADVLHERIRGGNLGCRIRDQSFRGRNTLLALFRGKPLRSAQVDPGEKPYLIREWG